MASVLSASGIPSIGSYEEALRVWENSALHPASQNEPDNWRVLDKRKNWILKIIKRGDQSVALRYHDTDVVTYYPDGRVLVQSYQSLSTNAFANKVLPAGMSAMFHLEQGRFMFCARGPQDKEKRHSWSGYDDEVHTYPAWYSHSPHSWDGDAEVYDIGRNAIFAQNEAGEWQMVDGGEEISRYWIDQKKWRAFKKEVGLDDFFIWARGYMTTMRTSRLNKEYVSDAVNALRDQSRWKELLGLYGYVYSRNGTRAREKTIEEGLTEICLRASGAVQSEAFKSIRASEFQKVLKSMRRLEYL